MTQKKIKPGIEWYFIGFGIFTLGFFGYFILFLLLFFGAFASNLKEGQRFKVPGEYKIFFNPGTYILYHEYDSYYEKQVFSTKDVDLSKYSLSLYYDGNPKEIELIPYSGISYTINIFNTNHRGDSLYEFHITEKGDYLLISKYKGDVQAAELIISIKKSVNFNIIQYGIISLFIPILLCMAGFVVLLVIFYKRRKVKNSINSI